MLQSSHLTVIKEYLHDLNDDALWYLHDAVFTRPVDYLAECSNILSCDREMDHCLSSATTVDHFFEMIDAVELGMHAEIAARTEYHRQKKAAAEKSRKEPQQAVA